MFNKYSRKEDIILLDQNLQIKKVQTIPEKIAHHTGRRIWRKLWNLGAFAFVHFEPVSNAIFFDCF